MIATKTDRVKARKKPVIPIFYTADDNYAPYLSVSIISLLKNASPDYFYDIYVVYDKMSFKNLTRLRTLKALREKDAKIHLKPMREVLDFMTERPNTRLNASMFTLTIYYRLFVAQMFPQFDKGIYLDSDTVVVDDISKLYNINLGKKNLLGAVNDFSIKKNKAFMDYIEKVVGVPRDKYFNSGVLLLNLAEMRHLRFDEHFLYLLVRYDFNTVAPDQDYLNAMCYGRVRILPSRWDAMPAKGIEPMKDPAIAHYNLYSKPWYYDNIDYDAYFWRYAAESPFLKEINAVKALPHSLDNDMKYLKSMMDHATRALKDKTTFKTVFESGDEIRAGRPSTVQYEIVETGWGWRTVVRTTLKISTLPITLPLMAGAKMMEAGAKMLKVRKKQGDDC